MNFHIDHNHKLYKILCSIVTKVAILICPFGDFENMKCMMVKNMIISLQPVIIFLNRISLSSADGLTQ